MASLDEFDANIVWQWHNDPNSLIVGITLAGDGDEDGALRSIQTGQIGNGHVQDLYSDAVNQYGSEFIFTRISKTSDAAANWPEISPNTDWQIGANHDSMADAVQIWSTGSPNWMTDIKGFGYFVNGQRHNEHVCNLYVACWAADQERLKGIVRGYFP